MKKEIALFGILAVILVSGCAVAEKTADTDGKQTIGTAIEETSNQNSANSDGKQDAADGQTTVGSENDQNADGQNSDNSQNSANNQTATGSESDQDGAGNTEIDGQNTEGTAGSEQSGSAAFNYFGYYIDKQGTPDSIYSDIDISEGSDGNIEVVISIFRLTTLNCVGTCTDKANVLEVYDEEMGVKGTVECTETSAVFTVTESEWSLLNVGDVTECSEKIVD